MTPSLFPIDPEVFTTLTSKHPVRILGLMISMLLALLVLAPGARAESDYETVLDQLGRLQALANQFVADQSPDTDPIELTLSYTRTGDYNTALWQLAAGVRDPAFEQYVADQDGDLVNLQGLNTVTLPNGQGIDFGHLLAGMNLVYKGMPITGSWGGDCMQLAQTYNGQASDAAGYMEAMSATFNMADDGSNSVFGDQDLRADLDSVVVGAQLTKDSDIAGLLRDYYADLSDYDRASQFIALSFGTVDTGATDTFRQTVYNTLVSDTGMQLLLYMNGLWTVDGWTLAAEYEQPMQGACFLFADYLSQTVNGEKIKSSSSTRMVTLADEALAQALETLGDSDAAQAALAAAQSGAETVSSGSDAVVDSATQTLRSLDVSVLRIILTVVCALGALGTVCFGVLTILGTRRK